MLITREIDYALRILRALSDNELKTIQNVCDIEGTPKQFAYRIIKKLQNMNWVIIYRGVDGGCKLIQDLSEVNLYDLMIGLGVDLDISKCLIPGFQCSKKDNTEHICNMQKELSELQKDIIDALKRRHIKDLIS